LIVIALQVRPLGSLRVISLHRQMIQRRTCRVLEFLAFLLWLSVLLSFFGLRTPLVETTEAALNANFAFGSFNITLGRILASLIAVWASFLVSSFLRFLLEEDVYHHLHLARGIPYAISTMLSSWCRKTASTASLCDQLQRRCGYLSTSRLDRSS
jgi:potassium-dependent mechanosensitive channel